MQVDRDRVMNACLDTFILQIRQEFAPFFALDDEQVKDVSGGVVAVKVRGPDGFTVMQTVGLAAGSIKSSAVPFFQIVQFDA